MVRESVSRAQNRGRIRWEDTESSTLKPHITSEYDVVLKSGTNSFHGSGWWFGQRSGTHAREFFDRGPNPRPNHERNWVPGLSSDVRVLDAHKAGYHCAAGFDSVPHGPYCRRGARASVSPQPQSNVRIKAPLHTGNAIHFVPFLGTESLIPGKAGGASFTFELPTLERGATRWLGRAK
jgi:hypothetical protein